MNDPATRYPQWKAPAEDGETLIWPEPKRLLIDTIDNHQLLTGAAQITLQNITLPEIRQATRRLVGHTDDAQPLVATGHQTELYHAGVWAKLALINQVTAKLGGSAIHFAVDTDSPKHLTLRWPGGSAPITDDPAISSAAWSGMLAAPSARHVDQVAGELSRAATDFGYQPASLNVLKTMRALTGDTRLLAPALTRATHELDSSLGLRQSAVVVSPILSDRGYLLFVHHLLARAARFGANYNAALAEYRRINRERSATRPMPDLFVSDESAETPFWLDDLETHTRTRPTVFVRDGAFVLELLNGEEFSFSESADGWDAATRLGQWLARTRHRLSPRALTLTMFLRLLVADQFVHGIGGGRYDQVADSIIENFFGIQAPKFAVTTATMYLPQALKRQRVCVPCVLQDGHRLKHRVLGEPKMQMVEQIRSLPRYSAERAAVFSGMHQQLKAGLLNNPAIARWEQRLRQAEQREAEDRTLFDRELFYAMQPRDRLVGLINKYAASFA